MFSAQADTAPRPADLTMSASSETDLSAPASAVSELPAVSTPANEAPPALGTKASSRPGHRKRARATSEQVHVLEGVFGVNRSPASRVREDLAIRLGMAPRQVQVWFQNRRAKDKSQQKGSRGLQNQPAGLYEHMVFANANADLLSMAMASSLMPVGADPGGAPGSNGFIGNPAALGFGLAAPPPHMGHAVPHHQQHPHPGQMFENPMALAAAASGAVPATGPAGVNPWLNWSIDMTRQTQVLPSPGHSGGIGLPPHPMHMPPQGSLGHVPQGIDSTSKADFGLMAASAAAGAPLYTSNICDSRRQSEMSGITAVASPIGLGPAVSESAATTASSAASPATTPAAATYFAVAKPEPGTSSAVTMTPGLVFAAQTDTKPTAMTADLATLPPCAVGGSDAHEQQNTAFAARRPAPLTLGPHHMAGSGAAAGVVPRMPFGYPAFIPEIPSYMALNATRLKVGGWQRVSQPNTELSCLACVEPPPPKPVQRPGNHRPAELDFLVGEFQWIISNCGLRYKMVLPYSTISRITFREVPDPAKGLVDPASDSVVNSQAALGLLNQALKNPHANGELAIHMYDTPLFYFQADGGEWREIGDFSEDQSASTSKVHTIMGPFAPLFYQLRVLLATCSRLKVSADSLMTLWLGNADDPYAAMAGLPQSSWVPCAGSVCLHSAQHSNTAASECAAAVSDASKMCIPVSAAASSVCTLTPTPTSTAFTFGDTVLPYHSSLAAAIAGGSVVQEAGAIKTQRSASLPFIRSAPGAAKAGSSSLSRTVAGDDGAIGLGISNTPPPGAAQPLRHRTSCNHLRRPAPYTVAQASGTPCVNSPQMSPVPHWWTGSIRRASRETLMPPGAFVRRESDVELALAMNSAFANGDVLGAHRSLSELCGAAGVPPSPLSNVAISAMTTGSVSASSIQTDFGLVAATSSAAMQTDSVSVPVMASEHTLAPAMHSESFTASTTHPNSTESLLLLPNDAYGPASKPGSAIPGVEGSGMFNANMMLAIFSAMTATPDGSNITALPAVSAPAGVVDPAALAFDPNTKGAAELWANWAQATSAQGLLPALMAPGGGSSTDMSVGWPYDDGSGNEMSVDWPHDDTGRQR
ncbi:hypothetical protein J3F80_001579 [Coemansia sp. RSA 2526]|nr:hypothetical protein J3F80_001579 [Coemansia sp. RSA 2526]